MTGPQSFRVRCAEWLVAAAAGAFALGLAALLTWPSSVPYQGHGQDFANLSADPLSLVGAFPQRILWPLLAHVTGLGGERSPAFSQVCSGLLLAVVFWFCRQRGARAADALLITVAVALTGAVQLYQVMTCHSDTLNWLLMLLLVHHVRRPFVFWPLVLLTALSHEMIFFFAPWLVYLRRRESGSAKRALLSLAVVVALYQCWRTVVKHVMTIKGSPVQYDVQYYLDRHWLPWGTPGLWLLWVMLLLVEFGPLLAVVVWGWRTNRLDMGRWGPWLYVACTLSLMFFAFDVQRFASYAFLPLVLGSLRFLETPRARGIYMVLIGVGVGIYKWMHLAKGLAGGWVYLRAANVMAEEGVIGDHSRFFTAFLPRVWWQALCVAAAAAAVVAAGLWLARRFQEGVSASVSAATSRSRLH